MVMELGNCTIEDILKKRKIKKSFWSENEILKISESLISALKAAKDFGLSHRDISLNNIILSRDLKEYKLIDFGEGMMMNQD